MICQWTRGEEEKWKDEFRIEERLQAKEGQTQQDKNTMTRSLSCAIGSNSIYLEKPCCFVELYYVRSVYSQTTLKGVSGTFMTLGELGLLGNTWMGPVRGSKVI